jgi:hypothetical protein
MEWQRIYIHTKLSLDKRQQIRKCIELTLNPASNVLNLPAPFNTAMISALLYDHAQQK